MDMHDALPGLLVMAAVALALIGAVVAAILLTRRRSQATAIAPAKDDAGVA
jgi:hypothetical protein